MLISVIRRHGLAVVRGAALFGLSLVALAVAMVSVVAATLVIPYPLAAVAIKRLTRQGRRLAGDWAGVPIEARAELEIPLPQQREDGWYVHDRQLYKSRYWPALLIRIQVTSKDPDFSREWLWMLTTAFTGGLIALVAPALVLVGLVGAVLAGTGTGLSGLSSDAGSLAGPVGVAVAIAVALVGLALAPVGVHLHGRWTRMVLGAPGTSWWHRSGIAPWVVRRSRDAYRGAGLVGLSLAAFGGFLLTVAAIVTSWGGLLPFVSTVTRPLNNIYRRYARLWTDVELPDPYLPYPPPPVRDADGSYRVGRGLHSDRAAAIRAQRYGWVLRDPATWRDLLWSASAPLFALPLLIPAALISFAFFGLVWQAVWWAPWAVPVGITTGTWVTPFYMWYGVRLLYPAMAVIPDWVSIPIGLAITLVGLLLARPALKLRLWWDRLLLNPTKSASLAQRVAHLTESRADAVDAQAAELRRIERDLHDGAQARLVSVGLNLATIERLMETDPDRARALVAQARESSATALTELRDLVRGIHPPVLAERGLGDAVRAVALDTPLPVEVSVDLPGRLEPPVESAAYFAVCEALANAVRHADAGQVDIVIRHHADVLHITVTDNGRGGADQSAGSGLRGIGKRLGTFDGVLTVDSPHGGPTVVTMEVPCALSSPKTSIS